MFIRKFPLVLPLLAGAALTILTGQTVQAQAPGNGGTTGGPPAPAPTPQADPTVIPLDGGASLLLAGGVAYGLRRLRRRAAR